MRLSRLVYISILSSLLSLISILLGQVLQVIGHVREALALGEVDISEQWIQEELEVLQLEEENINNVRRNVVLRQEHSLPFTSASSRNYFNIYIFLVAINYHLQL